jgi:chromosome segregation ATPase
LEALMATLKERVARVEHEIARVDHENAELKRAVEVQNIALGALVNKATLEKINEQNDKIFDTLMSHDQFTNHQLAELRGQLTEQDGKIVGMQTEMRQRFAEQDGKITAVDGKVVGLQTEMRQRFAEQDGKIVGLQQGFVEVRQEVAEVRREVAEFKQDVSARFNRLEKLLMDRLPPPQ